MQDDTHIHSLVLILLPLPLPLPLQLRNFVVGTTCVFKPPSSSCRLLCRILVTFTPILYASFSLSSRVPALASTPLTHSRESKFASPQPASPWPTSVHTFTLYLDIGPIEAVSTSSPMVTSCGSLLWDRRVVMIRIFQGAFLRRERKRKGDLESVESG